MVSTHGCQLSNFSWNRSYDQRLTESRTQPRMSECLRKEEALQRVFKFIEAFSKKRQTPAWQTSTNVENGYTWSSQVPLEASDTRTLHQWGWQPWRCPLASWQCQFLRPCQQQTSIHIPFKDCPSSMLLTNSAAASIMALNSQMKIMLNWILKLRHPKMLSYLSRNAN